MNATTQSAVPQAARPAPLPARPELASAQETPLEAVASMAVVLVVGLFLFGFVFQNFMIPSGSMKNTLLVGDHVVVDRITFSPPTRWAPFVHYRPVERGDIIVFLKPHPGHPDFILVKRAVAVAGDHLHLEHGRVYVNGIAQPQPFAVGPDDGNPSHAYEPYRDDFPRVTPSPYALLTALWREDLPSHIQNGELVVPPGAVFAMGDNRTESLDSRYWGFVPVENIEGTPEFVYWSFKTPEERDIQASAGGPTGFFLHEVTHFFSETRWARTFHITR